MGVFRAVVEGEGIGMGKARQSLGRIWEWMGTGHLCLTFMQPHPCYTGLGCPFFPFLSIMLLPPVLLLAVFIVCDSSLDHGSGKERVKGLLPAHRAWEQKGASHCLIFHVTAVVQRGSNSKQNPLS